MASRTGQGDHARRVAESSQARGTSISGSFDAEDRTINASQENPSARIRYTTRGEVHRGDASQAAFDQAEQRDPGHRRNWVVLVDGSRPQIEQILTEATVRGVRVDIVCDIIHVLEYLWKAAWTLHQAGAEAVLKLLALISNGDVDTYYVWHPTREHQRIHQTRPGTN